MIDFKVDIVILAGGCGTRLKSVVSDVPKVLAPINEQPFADLILNGIKKYSFIKNIVFSLGYKSDVVIDYIKSNNLDVDFSVEDIPLGTGGGLKKSLSKTSSDIVLVVNGDSYSDASYEDLLLEHIKNAGACTILSIKQPDCKRFGKVEFNIDTNQITCFMEKDDSSGAGYINAGVYVFNRDIVQEIPNDTKYSIEHDLFPFLIKQDMLYTYNTDSRFIDIGIPETYKEAQSFFL
jgi:NDP-sugar pyrophosphorylase family protein